MRGRREERERSFQERTEPGSGKDHRKWAGLPVGLEGEGRELVSRLGWGEDSAYPLLLVVMIAVPLSSPTIMTTTMYHRA